MSETIWVRVGAISGGLAVAAGAFAAHGLRDCLSEAMLAIFETAARYHMYHAPALLAVGLGMTAYGAAYFGFHDVVVHHRLAHRYHAKSRYMQRIIRAHLVHHKTTTKEGATSFGFLYAGSIEPGGAASHAPEPPAPPPK